MSRSPDNLSIFDEMLADPAPETPSPSDPTAAGLEAWRALAREDPGHALMQVHLLPPEVQALITGEDVVLAWEEEATRSPVNALEAIGFLPEDLQEDLDPDRVHDTWLAAARINPEDALTLLGTCDLPWRHEISAGDAGEVWSRWAEEEPGLALGALERLPASWAGGITPERYARAWGEYARLNPAAALRAIHVADKRQEGLSREVLREASFKWFRAAPAEALKAALCFDQSPDLEPQEVWAEWERFAASSPEKALETVQWGVVERYRTSIPSATVRELWRAQLPHLPNRLWNFDRYAELMRPHVTVDDVAAACRAEWGRTNEDVWKEKLPSLDRIPEDLLEGLSSYSCEDLGLPNAELLAAEWVSRGKRGLKGVLQAIDYLPDEVTALIPPAEVAAAWKRIARKWPEDALAHADGENLARFYADLTPADVLPLLKSGSGHMRTQGMLLAGRMGARTAAAPTVEAEAPAAQRVQTG